MFCAYHKKGQIAAYLVGVMVTILIGILLTVKIAKVNINKTYTSNASDAGALAGATMVANGLNTIYDMSTAMFANALATQLVLLKCRPCVTQWWIYAAGLALEVAMYAYAWSLGNYYCDQAETASIQLAFSNAGVKGDKDEFQDFMESLKDTKSSSYSWDDVSGGTATVNVTTNGPGEFKLIPFVAIVWFKGFECCPIDECCCCSCCCYCGPLPFIWGIAMAIDGCEKYMVKVDRYEPDYTLASSSGAFSQKLTYGTSSSTSWAQAYNAQWGSCWTCSKDTCCESCVFPIIGGEYDSWIVRTQ